MTFSFAPHAASDPSFNLKAPHFRSANFRSALIASDNTLPAGPLPIVYTSLQYNAFGSVHEAVFAVYAPAEPATVVGTFYARALENFQP